MKFNTDFGQRVAVHTASMPWLASPSVGVSRRMLYREGGEVARATTIVKYAPGSHFERHQHPGGEEFLVLEGVFQDQYGQYPAGSYVRNPPGSFHSPRSEEGCVLFVKLSQLDLSDHSATQVNIERLARIPDARRPGVQVSPLYLNRHEDVRVEVWAANAVVDLDLPFGGELLVLEGSFSEGGDHFTPQSWLRVPSGSSVRASAGWRGAKLWLKQGRRSLAKESPTIAHDARANFSPETSV